MRGLRTLGFAEARISPLAETLERYVRELLLFKNAGLVRADTRDELVVAHVLDSLAGAHAIAELAGRERSAHIGDIGSGAGFPGIPLAAALSGHRFTLVERMSTRCAFLENCVALTGLANAAVEHAEAERLEKGRFDVCVFRAFRPLDAATAKLLLSLTVPNGFLAAYKAKRERIRAEMAHISAIVPSYELRTLEAPFQDDHERTLVIIRNGGGAA